MIISHKHKFIFIKTEKTAGTSLEIALSKICGKKDIITPISRVDENYRRELGHRTCQNYLVPFSKYSKRDFLIALRRKKRLTFYNHIGAEKIKKFIGNEIWENYFTFTFERNPYDKIISWFYWMGGEKKYSSIRNFIQSGDAARIKGFELYTLNSEIVVDKVYKYEKLDEALKDISIRLDLKEALEMPLKKAKGNFRPNKYHYRDILSEDDREWVSKVFARELAFFGYEF